MATTLQDLFGIDAPIVLGPFGGLSSVELTAAVSEAGGLGSYGLYGYDADRISDTIAALHSATSRPFAVNLWLPTGDEVTPADVDLGARDRGARAALRRTGTRASRPAARVPARPRLPADGGAGCRARGAERGLRRAVRGARRRSAQPRHPDHRHRDHRRRGGRARRCRRRRRSSRRGAEAGGHRVSFLRRAEHSLVGTFALVPQVVDAVGRPGDRGRRHRRPARRAPPRSRSARPGVQVGIGVPPHAAVGCDRGAPPGDRGRGGHRHRAHPGDERPAGPRHPESRHAHDRDLGGHRAVPRAELAHRAVPCGGRATRRRRSRLAVGGSGGRPLDERRRGGGLRRVRGGPPGLARTGGETPTGQQRSVTRLPRAPRAVLYWNVPADRPSAATTPGTTHVRVASPPSFSQPPPPLLSRRAAAAPPIPPRPQKATTSAS